MNTALKRSDSHELHPTAQMTSMSSACGGPGEAAQ
eukprot:CAMPEP_0171144810 /NCGR_PEP_ID=MMETSP0766_2-20121228/146571_1 /TAXON_ID=439317 /ORGANISM="Gambierdiscus australes, Strain CAWD 149" /LENGTH=34 /DNA_ID= /DNA_START= /DNA_END= /DNA_ORIENTATION=